MWREAASVLFLSVVLAAPLAYGVWSVARSRLSLVQCLLWGAAYLLVKLLWRARWEGELLLPSGRGAVIVSNHRSSIDPFFFQMVTGRKIHWMVAREYCEHWSLKWFLRTCEVIPVGRGGIDTAATKAALRIVSAGGVVGMFPEGRINRSASLMIPGRPGAAHVALKAGVPLLPCYIEGSPYDGVPWSPLLMSSQVNIRFGSPIEVGQIDEIGSRTSDRDESNQTEATMLRCLKAIGELACQPAFTPQLAGRHWKPTAEELAAPDVDQARHD